MFKLIIKEQFEIGLPLIKAEFTMLDPTTYSYFNGRTTNQYQIQASTLHKYMYAMLQI